mmetsp:Transcript_14837/g.34295  ORF Transcript_14837/g.34295 Transcript_14837/m.34295 type:complete len:107 (-) Transcript_14837:515-835(-)
MLGHTHRMMLSIMDELSKILRPKMKGKYLGGANEKCLTREEHPDLRFTINHEYLEKKETKIDVLRKVPFSFLTCHLGGPSCTCIIVSFLADEFEALGGSDTLVATF